MESAIEEVRLPKTIIPVKYLLHYEDIDLKKWTFSGFVDIELNVKEECDFIMLNVKELSIASASYSVDGKDTEINKIIIFKKQERAVFMLEEKLKVGTITLHVVFNGTLNDYMQGFYRSKYSVDGEEKYMATTQFESTDARMAFPCWDEPALKSRFRVFLTTPLGYTAVSNMPILKKMTIVRGGEKKNVFEFDETPIMSTYLLAYVVGELDVVSGFTKEGIQVNAYTPLGKSEWGEFALKVGLHSISFYSDFFKVPYPLKKLDLLPIPDFAAGAMENWGCVTFREVDLLIDQNTAAIANKQRVSLVVAHEIAHMWFGDLVTMEWWTHLWLNEGFASYMEYVCVDDLFPEWNMFIEFYNDSVCTAFYDDSFVTTHPIEVAVKYPDEIDQIFDGISYNKGSTVINMLVNFIGKEAFRQGMSIYLNRHAYQNTCTEDLWRALGEGSNIDCEGIMRNWTQEPGFPLLVLEEKNGSIVSHQQVYYSNPSESVKLSNWSIPLAIVTPAGTEQILYTNETRESFDEKITRLVRDQKWVKINQNTLCLVQYTSSMLQALHTAVRGAEVCPLDRIQLLLDMKRLCNSQQVKPSEVLRFLEAYKEEKEASVIEVVASVLLSFYSYVDDDDAELKASFQTLTRSMLHAAYERCGWDSRENESKYETTSRPVILLVLSRVCNDEEIKAEALRRFAKFMKDGDEVLCHTEIRSLCLQEGVRQGTEQEVLRTVDALMKKYDETTGAEKRRILLAVGQAMYPSILNKVLNFSLDGTVRKQDTYTCFGSVVRNKKFRKLCWQYLSKNLDALHENLKKSFNMLGYFVEAGASVLDTEQEMKEFMDFFARPENNLKEVSRSIDTASQNIKLNITMKAFMNKYLKEYFC